MISPSFSPAYQQRLDLLHARKLEYARQKRAVAPLNADESGAVPLPPERVEVIEAMSGSGELVKATVLKGFAITPNHPSGGFFGAKACGENFRRLLEVYPTYLDPANSMAGVLRLSFISYRKPGWNPDYDYSHLHAEQNRYGIEPGIGGVQHFCPDLRIGLELGWGGLLAKVRHYRGANPQACALYQAWEDIILGVQAWIRRHAEEARQRAAAESNPEYRQNLETIAAIAERLVEQPPATFRAACQWLVFFQAVAKTYNGSGEWGQLDELLRPYYERDKAAGTLDDDEAIFHLACLLLSETAYAQLGGPDASGKDQTSAVSFLILEAVRRLRVPANIAVRVGDACSAELFRAGLEVLFETRTGFPKFAGDKPLIEGCLRNGLPLEAARTRLYAGCHWLAIPGREYTMADLIKIDFAMVFDTALRELLTSAVTPPSVAGLWERFEKHLARAVEVVAEGIDFHLQHMHAVFPELLLDLFCHGPVEKGRDVTDGGVEFYHLGVDGASLATVADSFAALEQRIEQEGRLSWPALQRHLDRNWSDPDGEAARLMMRNVPRFGSGDSLGDTWAQRIARRFAELVTAKPTQHGFKMVPGLFSWAKVLDFGARLGATPNGRRAGEPVSHGPNPAPGFNGGRPGTPTQMVRAVAKVQPGYGNTAPLQLDLDPGVAATAEGLAKVEALIRTHFDLGGTLVNLNVLDKQTLLAAQRDPEAYPDLIVRVTGFSAYFASLSPEMRAYVVDRVVQE